MKIALFFLGASFFVFSEPSFASENFTCGYYREILKEKEPSCFFGEIFWHRDGQCHFFCDEKTSCPSLLSIIEKDIVSFGEPKTVSSSSVLGRFVSENSLPIVTYSLQEGELAHPVFYNVPPELLRFQKDTVEHEKYWNFIEKLIPKSFRAHLVEIRFVSDGTGGKTGFVSIPMEGTGNVRLEIDPADADDIVYNILHEFAHLIATSPEEQAQEALFEQCGENTTSFLQAFTNQFWDRYGNDFYELSEAEDSDEYSRIALRLGKKYPNAFLTEYATKSPVEDFSETFAYFLLSPRPEGDDLSDKKIQFFWKYPEMVRLRVSLQWRLLLLKKRGEVPSVYR
ncbi:hypothetical protein IPN35_03735 [Candidatus Peregrinibacteria bacterium]|nr:MAG: hypothetical protein IPN35_03735 [Candidatus Peregrinibacteria bacterium]